MMRSRVLAAILLAVASSPGLAATVTAVSTVTCCAPAPNGLFSVTVHGDGFPTTAGATLGLTWNPAVVEVTGVTLAPGSPFTGGVVASAPWSLISVLGPLVGTLPSGSFDAFTINFRQTGALGFADIRIIDDQVDICWADAQTSECVRPVSYVQADVGFCLAMPNGCATVPVPAVGWLLAPGFALMARRRNRRA